MRVAIFTGSRSTPGAHVDEAAAFVRALVADGVSLVYGGGRAGLMGVVADAALAAGGDVIGVIPQHLVDLEVGHRGLTRLEVVGDMHERKARMAELADAFVALPGGVGTLEELFEAFTWGQLGLHEKPTALLDLDGFYRPLVEQLQAMVHEGYLDQAQLDALGVVSDAGEFLAFAAGYRHPQRTWLPAPRERAGHRPTPPAGGELASVAWLHVRDGRLLATRSHGRDRFYLPGGKLEPGETPEQALVREVEEELGVRLRAVRPAFSVEAPAHGYPAGTRLTMHCFFADPAGEPRAAREIAELAWLEKDDAERAAPAVQRVLARLNSSFSG